MRWVLCVATARTACNARKRLKAATMIRWMILIFILLVLVNSATGIIQKVGLGRLPGYLNFRCFGRQVFVPFASAVLVTVLLFSTIKLVAWLF